jgi:hypothetical protein
MTEKSKPGGMSSATPSPATTRQPGRPGNHVIVIFGATGTWPGGNCFPGCSTWPRPTCCPSATAS